MAELRRRNVLRVGAAYLVAAWLLIQVAETILPLFGFDDTPTRILVIVLSIAFVPVLVLAWLYELTPEGLVRDAGRAVAADAAANKRFDRLIVVALVLAVAIFATHTFVIDPARDAARLEEATRAGRTEAIIDAFGEKSIAVLPFANLSPDPDKEFFADGVSEELLNLLAKVDGLRVTSRTSSFQFKDTELSIPEIAGRLGVAHVLEGSVRWAGNRIRITAQLIAADSDTHLWSETYDREFVDVFAIQDDVAARVVQQLKIAMDVGLPVAQRHDPEAYALFVKARQLIAQSDPTNLGDAIPMLQRVLEIEPGYIDARLSLSRIYLRLSIAAAHDDDYERSDELLEKHVAGLREVEAIDPRHPGLNALLTWHSWQTGEDQNAAEYLETAVEGAPLSYNTLLPLATMFDNLGRPDAAIRVGEYLTSLDPLGYWGHANLGDSYLHAGEFGKAIDAYRSALAVSPGSEAIRWKLGGALLVDGRPQEALEYFEDELHAPYRLHGLALALHDLGDAEGSAAAMAELHRIFASNAREHWWFGFARAYAWLGDADNAFEYLYRMRDDEPRALSGFQFNPYFSKVRDDPRWQPLVDEVAASMPEIRFDPKLPPELLVD